MKHRLMLPPYILQNLIWIPTRIILRYFIDLKIEGLEHLRDVRTPVIFASNHTSELDPVLIPAALPLCSRFSPIFYVSRERSFYTPTLFRRLFWGGTFFKLWGAHPTLPGLGDYARSLATHVSIILGGGSLSIFPEGKMGYEPGIFHEAKGGVAYLSHATRAVIIPVGIDGSYQITPRQFLKRNRKVRVVFGRPIAHEDLFAGGDTPSPEEYKRAAREVMDRVRGLLGYH